MHIGTFYALFGEATDEVGAIAVALVFLGMIALILRSRHKRQSIERFTRRYGR